MEENFDHLEGWDLLVESRQYRGQGGKNFDLRTVADFAFLDLIAVFILSNEYESAPIAANYAEKTMFYRNFNKARLAGTDLYTSLNILANPDSVFSRQIKQNVEADEILRNKIRLQLPTVKRYLDLLAGSQMRSEDAQVLLLRLEKQLNITDSKLKSIRRLAQQWPSLTTMQRDLIITRMLQFYKRHAKRSEMMHFLEDMGKTKGYKINGPIDAEMANLGLGGKLGAVAKAVAPVAAGMAAYHLTKYKDKDIKGFGKDIYGKWRGTGPGK